MSGRFARITRISDSLESPDSRESCESIRANHATKPENNIHSTRNYELTTEAYIEGEQMLDPLDLDMEEAELRTHEHCEQTPWPRGPRDRLETATPD